jgi:leader peptidase (prepilin peptidase)/N-methyltransferase
MPVVVIASWTAVGLAVGCGLAANVERLLTTAPRGPSKTDRVVPLVTALAFGVLAGRFGLQFDLLPYSVLAALGVMLGLIDLIEQRLPSALIYSGVALIGALLATAAVAQSRGTEFGRALTGMVVLAALYLVLAVASRGGLGAGDVKLGGLLGLALGWLSWSALLAATFLGWLAAALAWLVLCSIGRRPNDSALPMGPFLLLGAFVTVTAMPT